MSDFFSMTFDMDPLTMGDVILRILLSVLLGGVVGMERGMRNRPAGFRTHILVCMGACMAILTNEFVFDAVGAPGADPTRIGAQVISGIGFLGVGTIFMARRNAVRGLTTAAGLWASATLGLAIGVGFYFAALLATVIMFIVLSVFLKFESVIYQTARRMQLSIETTTLTEEKAVHEWIVNSGHMVKSRRISSVSNRDDRVTAHYTVQVKKGIKTDAFVCGLAQLPGVEYVETL